MKIKEFNFVDKTIRNSYFDEFHSVSLELEPICIKNVVKLEDLRENQKIMDEISTIEKDTFEVFYQYIFEHIYKNSFNIKIETHSHYRDTGKIIFHHFINIFHRTEEYHEFLNKNYDDLVFNRVLDNFFGNFFNVQNQIIPIKINKFIFYDPEESTYFPEPTIKITCNLRSNISKIECLALFKESLKEYLIRNSETEDSFIKSYFLSQKYRFLIKVI